MKKYNIGLDIGNTSVGWAVVESEKQKIIRKGNKPLWGVRLFEEAATAVERRNFRSTRRRYERRRNRIKYLQEEFKDEINKVDPNFFTKLKESFYHETDDINKTIKLTEEEKRELKKLPKDKKYKTIYHLRQELITNQEKKDIRLVYLAIHHIIKYRGNFLYKEFKVENINIEENLESLFESILELCPTIKLPEDYKEKINISVFGEKLLDPLKNDRKKYTQEYLKKLLPENKKFVSEFTKMMNGNKFNINKMLEKETEEKLEISFDGTDYEDNYDKIEKSLKDQIKVLDLMKELYNSIILKNILKGSSSKNISGFMIEKYDNHKDDLEFLKDLFKNNKEIYHKVFKTKKNITKIDEACLYEQYIKNNKTYDKFIKEIEKYIQKIFDKNIIDNTLKEKYNKEIKDKIEDGKFLPRISEKNNGIFPYQLNKDELEKILDNQGKYYPFLKESKNKIIKLLEFKIPYYVGPLATEDISEHAWLIKKQNEKITPYNFEEVIDIENTAEKFIKRMTSSCTYLLGEPVMPSNSIIYSRFKVMNELKQIKINGLKIPNELQHKIIKELFETTPGTITNKKFQEYLYSTKDFEMYGTDINVTGYSDDNKFANNLNSYIDFLGQNGIFENTSYNAEDAEKIIEWITIFEDKEILEKKIRKTYKELTDTQINKILSIKYSGWGKLSKKLLTDIYYKDKRTGITKSIMDLMEETEENFNQIIYNNEYNFQKMISDINNKETTKKINYKLIENLVTSPSTKRGIYQALKVVKEITDYMGYDPEEITIEMARGKDNTGRKPDRKSYLMNIYNKIKQDIEEYNKLTNQLNKFENKELEKNDKLFLYFIQEGKSLYSGEAIKIENLNEYEIDHIYPRSIVKDDSFNNKALVHKNENQAKGASLVLPENFRNDKTKKLWDHLVDVGLISPEKRKRLLRREFNQEEIDGFINRQLVETRQITKHVANILGNIYDNSKIIYINSKLSVNYRQKYELFKFRDINDYHHAHDAYLAAVLGEYKEKHLRKKINFEILKELNKRLYETKDYKSLKYGYAINSLDSNMNDIINEIVKPEIDDETGEVIFNAEEFNKRVTDTLYRNDILISRKTEIKTGKFYKENPLPHNSNKINSGIELKNNLPKKYGFYTELKPSYLTLVEYKNKNHLIGIPIMCKNIRQKIDYISNYLKCEKDDFRIIIDKIEFNTLINYKNQPVYLTGSGELMNAYEIKIPKEKMIRWKHTLNLILNNKPIPKIEKVPILIEEEINTQINEIINYLLSLEEKLPLYKNSINKVKSININELNIDDKKKLIKELFKMLSASKNNADLKFIGGTDREGRLTFSNIEHTTITYKSPTGIREVKDEF